jgi:NADH-quinone oxidoreductase subunit A
MDGFSLSRPAQPEGDGSLYDTVFFMFLAAGFIGAAALAVGGLLGPKKANETTLAAYESGIPASGTARERFPVHFYLVAMLFIIFDIETAFFYPLAVKFGAAPQFLFVQAIIFVIILGVGYVYILKKGVLNWK